MSDDKIDVMAVMDRLMRAPCDACSGDCGSANPPVIGCPQREAIEARAAIAELIEADREYDLAAAALLACTNKPAHTLVTLIDYADEARSLFEAAKTRRAAALSQTAGVADGPLSGKYGDVLRPFVIQMERELHANAGKGDRPGWLKMSPEVALLEIYYHLAKLQKAVKDNNGPGIQEYAADVANMSMMLLDICGGLALIEYAAPAASGAHPDALPDGTLSKSTAKRVTALAAASVSERARELLAAEYRTHGWHEDAGRLCMGGDPTSFVEDDALRVITRLIEQGDEDTHVITELGRLLASIAVILKGPEPAGTAWSYHDLPSLVASEVAEPRQVAAEMKAWAHTKMAEQQSSRRDRMMVSEWAKRLLPESSFPIKDFDVEGMSITKEAAREAVKRVALEQALTQQRGEVLDRPARVGGRDFKAGELVRRVVGRAHAEYDRHHGGCLRHPYTGELRDYRDVESDPDGTLCVGPGPLAATTPQPSADAVRELVQRWRDRADAHEHSLEFPQTNEQADMGRSARVGDAPSYG